MGIDLRKLTAKQILNLAKSISGKSNEEIAEELEQDHSSVKRYFQDTDKTYYPSLMRLPKLCRALENTILLEWVQVQVGNGDSNYEIIRNDSDLLRKMNRLAAELGDVHRSVDKSLSQPCQDSHAPDRLLTELFKLESRVRELRRSLEQARGERIDSEGWATAMAEGD